MAKVKQPLLSLDARRKLGDDIVYARRRKANIVERRPIPLDARSVGQLSWRHMFQKVVALWHDLSAGEKEAWESLGRKRHMTGYAWFVSQALRPNPGIYLPLQGGTMSGDIDMVKHRLLSLPLPSDSQEAASKAYADTFSKVVWKDTPPRVLNDVNRVASLGYTDLDLTASTSANAKFAMLGLHVHIDNYTNGHIRIRVRKNGTTPTGTPACWGMNNAASLFWHADVVICGLDGGQVLEYALEVEGVGQADFLIDVLGYIE